MEPRTNFLPLASFLSLPRQGETPQVWLNLRNIDQWKQTTTESLNSRAAVYSDPSFSGYLPIKPDTFQRLTPDSGFQHSIIQRKYHCTFLIKRVHEMIPNALIDLWALFCESFGQMRDMIKISGKRRPIWLLRAVEQRFKIRQLFCTESISTRLDCQTTPTTSTHD